MKAKKLPSGSWRCRAYAGAADGKKTYKSFTAPTKREAEYLANQFLFEQSEYNSDDCSIKSAIDRYISNRESVLSPSTVRNYRTYQRNAYKPIEHFAVSAITSEKIQAYINLYAKNHSPKTVRNAYGLLNAAIHAVNPSKVLTVTLPQKEVYNRRIPNDENVKALLDAAHDHETRSAIVLASVGTLRRGEVCSLTYEDIHGDTIHVHSDMVQSQSGEWVIKEIPKTNSSDRYVTLPQKAIEYILDTPNPTGRIVSCTPNALGSRFRTVCKRAGIKCRFHDLRHYAASIMHAIGIPDQYIMEVGGWQSDTILKSVYRNVLDDKKNEFTEKRNNYMEKFF